MRFPSRALLSRHAVALLSAVAEFGLLQVAGEVLLRSQRQDRANQRHIEMRSHAPALRVRVEGELNAVLNLGSGLAAYLGKALLEHATPDMLEAIARRLRSSIQEPIDYQGRPLQVGVSIGVALYPDDGSDLDQLLHAADGHMYSDRSERRIAASRPAPLAE